jgi:hypothetical protein
MTEEVRFASDSPVEETRQAETLAAKRMIERSLERFELYPERLIGDTAYGSAEMLDWLVQERGIEPHIPVFDKSQRSDGTFSRARQRYYHPLGPMLPRPARLCRPRRSPQPAPQKTPASRRRKANTRERQVRTRLATGGSRIRTLGPGATKPEIALSSGQTAGTMAGARPLIRSTNREANRQARPLVINARR